LQTLKSDKQRTGIDFEHPLAHLFDSDGDSISMHGLEGQGFKDEQVESPLDDFA
jgi:hypothetical protein